MVTAAWPHRLVVCLGAWLEIHSDEPLPIERLDGATRVSVIMALVGLGLVWLLVIAMIVLGARWARHSGASPRRAANRRSRKAVPDPDDWARKPLIETEKRKRPPPNSS